MSTEITPDDIYSEPIYDGLVTGKPVIRHTKLNLLMHEVMEVNESHREIKVLDHGSVSLLDCMPRVVPRGRTLDVAVVEAARLSYAGKPRSDAEDRGLIRYLLRHHHTTPFEQVEFKFHARMPIFVARQWVRHRMASINEVSARYTQLKDEFYIPDIDVLRKQSKVNKQGRDEPMESGNASYIRASLEDASQDAYSDYSEFTAMGLARELSRMRLPVNIYTEWYWKIDLHNLLRFLWLRMDAHAQWEIRQYADALHDLIAPLVPHTMEAWRDFSYEAIPLSRLEAEALAAEVRNLRTANARMRERLPDEPAEYVIGTQVSQNEREQSEWRLKRFRLGLTDIDPRAAVRS